MKEKYKKLIVELYVEQYRHLLGYAKSSLKNEALAEEAVQEAFSIACAKAEQLYACPNPRGWMVNTLKFVVANMKRRQEVASKIVSDYMGDQIDVLPAPSEQLDPDLLYGNVADSEEFRLMKAIALEGRSLIELAEDMGISVDACKKRVQRARKLLQRKI